MKKYDVKVDKKVWVEKISKGVGVILSTGRITDPAAQEDLIACAKILENAEGAPFNWNIELYTNHASNASPIPVVIRSQDHAMDLQENESKVEHNDPGIYADSIVRPKFLPLAYHLMRLETPPFWGIGRFVFIFCSNNVSCEAIR